MQQFIRFACPSCGKSLKAKSEQAGRRVRCPGRTCGEPLRVPDPWQPEEDSGRRVWPWLIGVVTGLLLVLGLGVWLLNRAGHEPPAEPIASHTPTPRQPGDKRPQAAVPGTDAAPRNQPVALKGSNPGGPSDRKPAAQAPPQGPKAEAAQPDPELQGTWRLHTFTYCDPERKNDPAYRRTTFVISSTELCTINGNEMTVRSEQDGKVKETTYTLAVDQTRKPKAIKRTAREGNKQTTSGICGIVEGKLVLCTQPKGLPAQLDVPPQSEVSMETWERVRAGEQKPPAPTGPPAPPPARPADGPLQLSDLTVTGATEEPPGVSFTVRIQGGKGKRQDMWVGLGDPQVMKKFAKQAKGPLGNRLGLLALSGPGFYIGPVAEWSPAPGKADVSRCRMEFNKVRLNAAVATVTVMVFEDGGEVVSQSVEVNFRTGKAEAGRQEGAEAERGRGGAAPQHPHASRISCPSCRAELKVPSHSAGTAFRCPRCQGLVTAQSGRKGHG